MGKKRINIIVFGVAAVLALGLIAFGIWRVNRKVNNLYETVIGLNETVNSLTQKLSSVVAYDRTLYIPDLDPHTEGWKVTQFGDPLQSQEMCYTITTDTGLIIIDGGMEYEESRLRNIISQYGNSVEAWILTHPHPDHITAFMDIYDDPQGIVIHNVYAVEMPDMEILQSNASWDDYTSLERFLEMDIPELTYLHTGDRLTILGLEFEVFSAYCDKVDELSNDLLNDGSMMFRICGSQDSMLFCADVGKSMTDYLIEMYGEDLKSDYVQMGHHGYGGLNVEFYEIVDPIAAFFDAPDWLMSGENEKSTEEKEELMKTMGVEIISFYTAPNQILIE
ncbi:MAG: MBL fold metallo-hydrolase [Lachnospiraceae bacterium]|nr:MBL fold metallo-hydrolase [Lachnospiraceae bacterium]